MTVNAGSVSMRVSMSATGSGPRFVIMRVVSVAVVVSVFVTSTAVGMPVILSVPVTMC